MFLLGKNGSKKRSRSENDRGQFLKRPREENMGFRHLGEFESNLDRAMEYATEGDRIFMNLRLEMAKENAIEANAMQLYESQATEVRKSLSKNEKPFHLRELERNLERAMEYAKEGDKCFMDLRLDAAKKNAIEVGAIHTYEKRLLEIHEHYKNNEVDFHLRSLVENLERAMEYAKEGNRCLMDLRLNTAKNSAIAAGAIDAYEKQSLQVRESFKNEKEFHQREVESNLERAMQYAKDGDKTFMKLRLHAAQEHAKSVGYQEIGTRQAEIQSVCNTKIASKETEEADILIEKELDVGEVIAKRIDEATSKGEVIDIT
mmetsp:Transcript_16092/g.24320  ORF Transcript_16092/g.24320 Transcript_16092/m.24320 type:complete len:317 (-) Transcript_16092:19-969(-)